MAKKIFRSEGFIVVELSAVNLRRIPIANFSYLFVGVSVHINNEQTKANYTEQTTLLENEAGAAIGNEAAVTTYLDSLLSSSSGDILVPSLIRKTDATGSPIAAGAKEISIKNVGGADGTVQGVVLKVSESVKWTAQENATLAAVTYNGTGTELLIVTTVK